MQKFSYGVSQLTKTSGSKQSCLLTNGLGGYSALNLLGAQSRNDHALLIGAINAPDLRMHLVSNVHEVLMINDEKHVLGAQDYVDYTKNEDGNKYLINVTKEYLITYTYLVKGVKVTKTIVMEYANNCVGIKYTIYNPLQHQVELVVTPTYQFVEKGELLSFTQEFNFSESLVQANDIDLYVKASAAKYVQLPKCEYIKDYYYADDAKDGRFAYGISAYQQAYHFSNEINSLCFSLTPIVKSIDELIDNEIKRQQALIETSGTKSSLAQSLVVAADQFIVERSSTNTQTILAGYPFFLDWGRDTMYALEGCCLSTKKFSTAKSILNTFIAYLDQGLMPNSFRTNNQEPLYNTVDASLLFFESLYLYYLKTNDLAYVESIYQHLTSIIENYKQGTKFDIKMDTDGLIQAGSGLMQLTWMDIRFEDILPTPRHGKPVEINAYWYNALCIYDKFSKLLAYDNPYQELISLVKTSFQTKFYDENLGYLKDVVSGNAYDNQLRCNQIWAVSISYSPLTKVQAQAVVNSVYDKLYTPYGLRTLSYDDIEFKANYGGSLKERDLAYHQGTVWPFPLGAYFRAYLKVNDYSKDAIKVVEAQLSLFNDCLAEGCVGQIAEIYDGLYPSTSQGCFGQAWSVAEILKVIVEIEELAND